MLCLVVRLYMPEQMTMSFGDISHEKSSDEKTINDKAMPASSEDKESQLTLYEPLDFQLAKLFEEQNGEPNKKLKNASLEVSKHTREGQIFIPCDEELQADLLKTNIVGRAGDYKPLIIDNKCLYLNRYFSYQESLANRIKARLQDPESENIDADWIKQRLDFYFANDTIEGEVNHQREAAEKVLKKSFLILSGGPGTGKTTTISRILALLIEQHIYQGHQNQLRILLAAPTGKAAIRMLDSLHDAQSHLELTDAVIQHMPTQASTIHKLLGYQHNRVQFKHTFQNPLNADVILVDEASMIDVALMAKLANAVPASAKFILIGDKDQLSSVETGSVFSDVCASLDKSPHLVSLQKNWRFSKDSGIGQIAIAVNSSDSRTVLEVLEDETKPECRILSPVLIENNQLPPNLIEPWSNYFELLKNKDSEVEEIFEAFNQFRVLCTLRKGYSGSTIMSNRIEEALLKMKLINHKTHTSNDNHTWYHGRPVMISQNSYSKGLFNGDTGIALRIEGELKVYFSAGSDHAFKSISPVRLPAHESTWAMTIHKSQGSEFNEVALIMPHEVMPLLTRQLIYTGITRAKESVTIIANEEIIEAGVKSEMVKATQIEHMICSDQ